MDIDRAIHASAVVNRASTHDDLRSVMNAILYIASTGCQWRQLPKDFSALFDRAGLFL